MIRFWAKTSSSGTASSSRGPAPVDGPGETEAQSGSASEAPAEELPAGLWQEGPSERRVDEVRAEEQGSAPLVSR